MRNSRRDFIKATGCLTIGFCLGNWKYGYPSPLSHELPEVMHEYAAINAWLEVLADGRIRVFTGKLELGQGIRTAVAQVAAEELYLEMADVEVILAETGRTPDEGYTAGSGSIENSAMAVRYAAASARQKLLELAARKLNTSTAQLDLARGKISTKTGNRTLTFAEVLDGRQFTDEVSSSVILKPKDQYRLVGKAVPRDDISLMVSGEPVYVQDLRFPGMVHARIIHPPAYGSKLVRFDEQVLRKKFPGLLKTVVNGSFLGVIAADEYEAVQVQKLLHENSKWSDAPSFPQVSRQQLADYLKSLPSKPQRVHESGNIGSLSAGDSTLKARYFKPYIMHGSIGPSCAVALYDKNTLHVWTHSQGVYPLRESLAAMLHLPADHIHVKGVPGSGCYGHNGADDVAAEAALLAMAYPGKHIRLQWSREDEHTWEPYGSAMVMETEARLDSLGKISHWKYDLWSDTHGARPAGNAENLLPARYLEKPFTTEPSGYSGGAYRNSEPYYAIPNQQVDVHFFKGPLRVSSLRGLGAYANIFAIESFMDELAEKAGKDPYEFRLIHLEDERAKAALRKLQSLTQGQETPQTGIGIAFSRYKNSASYCAVAARVAVNTEKGTAQVQKMWAVIDAGEVINTDGLKNQTEGGMIQSASWTLMEQVHFNQKQIISHNWDAYPIFRFDQVPEVKVEVLDRPAEKALGAGEAAQGPAAAAIANAVYRACGKRIRYLPLLSGLSTAKNP